MRAPRPVRPLWVAALLTVMSAATAFAQRSPILPETRVIRGGPVSFYPTIALRDAGVDSNVFNESTEPRSDFTYSVLSRLFLVTEIGNSRFIGTGFGRFVYFQTYKEQQTLSGSVEGRYEITSPGFRPFASARFADHRERRGFEIDARLRQRQTTGSVGLDADTTTRTALTAWVAHVETKWDRDDQYLGIVLGEQLDKSSNTVGAGVRMRATPLTTVALTGEWTGDRFDHEPVRDADRLFVGPAIDFDAGAIVIGHVKAGYQRFSPLDSAVAQYSGLAGSSSIETTLFDMTKLKFEASRDVDYSYDPLQPYYLESGGLLTVTQRIVGPFEVIASGERHRVRNQRLGQASFNGRAETTTIAAGGVAIQFRKQVRFELIYERRERTSSEPSWRNYERRRLYASAIYGL